MDSSTGRAVTCEQTRPNCDVMCSRTSLLLVMLPAPPPCTSAAGDEATIAEHDKDRGTRRKIEEPKTPYRWGSRVRQCITMRASLFDPPCCAMPEWRRRTNRGDGGAAATHSPASTFSDDDLGSGPSDKPLDARLREALARGWGDEEPLASAYGASRAGAAGGVLPSRESASGQRARLESPSSTYHTHRRSAGLGGRRAHERRQPHERVFGRRCGGVGCYCLEP
jgi:hypothetical protein